MVGCRDRKCTTMNMVTWYNHEHGDLNVDRGYCCIFSFCFRKGASPLSMGSLCGVGDLVLTCTGSLSRNWTVGNRLARGEVRRTLQMVILNRV